MAVRNPYQMPGPGTATGVLDDPNDPLGLNTINPDAQDLSTALAPTATKPPAPTRTPYSGTNPTSSPYTDEGIVPPGGTATIPPTANPVQPAQLGQNKYASGDAGQARIMGAPPAPDTGTQPNAAGRGVPMDQYFHDAVTNFGLHAAQSNPTSLQPLVDMMNTEGYHVTLAAPSSGGYVKGIYINGDPNQFVKLLDGSDNWIWQPGGDAGGGDHGGPGSNVGGLDLSTMNAGAMGLDPNADATNAALLKLIQGGGVTPFGSDVQRSLADIISRGGTAPSMDADLIAAREAEANAMTSMMGDARSQLADRGTLSEPGIAQGPNEEAVANVNRSIAPGYSAAVADIGKHYADLKNQSLTQALTLATGMSEQNANAMLQAIGTGTQRTAALGNIALTLLRDNMDWNQFLATNGLDQARLEAEIQNNNNSYVLGIIQQYVAGGGVLDAGYIPQ